MSRKAYTNFLKKKADEGYTSTVLAANEAPSLLKGKADELSLFSEKQMYCTEGLEKVPFRKSAKIKKDAFYESLVEIGNNKEIILVTWEADKPGRLLKLKDCAVVYESAPAQSIFTFLDHIYPGNKLLCIEQLRELGESQEEMFLFVMLMRHVRSLLLAKRNELPSSTSPWQRSKYRSQSAKWDERILEDFYEGLIRLETGIKTSMNAYGIRKSIEILCCHYL